jgi:tetratricopeptide (TPR) repeat protein
MCMGQVSKRMVAATFLVMSASMGFNAHAQDENHPCGPLRAQGQYGPYDYRTDKKELEIVERVHFPHSVEITFRGKGGDLGGGFDYTLRAYPNHHRALMALWRYGEKMRSPKPPQLRWTIECYFDRALRFAPDDLIVRMIFAMFLGGQDRVPQALAQLDYAANLAGDSQLTHVNIGLVYFDLKAYDKALQQAHKAHALGAPHEVLQQKLKSVGKWVEPEAQPAAKQP